MTTELTELQRDALTEIFNVGVGQAANSLSQIVGQEIALSVPRLDILSGARPEALNSLIRSPRICAISQDFAGIIDTRAFLVFPEGKTLEIVRRMLGETVSLGELGEMEQEALSEIGNIILNSCISAISEVFGSEFRSSLPTYHSGSVIDVLVSNNPLNAELLLLLHIDFSIPSDRIDGHLVFFMALPSFNVLTQRIDRFLKNIV